MLRLCLLALLLLTVAACAPLEMNEQQRAFIAAGGLRQPPIKLYRAPPPYQMQVPRMYNTTCNTVGTHTYCTTR